MEMQQQQPTVVYVQQSGVNVGPEPCRLECPSCKASIATKVLREASTKTHLIALLLCLFGCCCCACIPYCTDSCLNANHYCPNCNSFIGSYKN